MLFSTISHCGSHGGPEMNGPVEITGFELMAVDFPFRQAFVHAAKKRTGSETILLRCTTSTGGEGFGEALPRPYVTGESLDDTFDFLKASILPRLLGARFSAFSDVVGFLRECDGEPPPRWAPDNKVRTAAWCAIDLGLLDAFGKSFRKPVVLNNESRIPGEIPYSAVVTKSAGLGLIKTLLKVRLYGFTSVKFKVTRDEHTSIIRLARYILGRKCSIRVDVNMDWTFDDALRIMPGLAKLGVRVFEQPLHPDDLSGAAVLVKEKKYVIMADEGLHNSGSMERLIEHNACNAVNIRLSKCGGLIASLARCHEAHKAGFWVQIGCQAGETSLLSAAQLTLLLAYQNVRFIEGAFGELLLQRDPCQPVIQFRYGGRPPIRPQGYGFGVSLDRALVRRMTTRRALFGDAA